MFRLIGCWGTALGIAALLCVSSAQSREAGVVFLSNADGDLEIYFRPEGGQAVRKLTENDRDDIQFMVSPDGERLVYTSMRDRNPEIYMINLDGSNDRRLTNHPAADVEPRWSPDGSRIAFVSNREGAPNIYIVDVAGGGARNVAKSESGAGHPRWSPDGTRIAFSEGNSRNNDIVVVAVSSGERLELTDDPKTRDYEPEWAPDGKRIAFMSRRKRIFDVYVVDLQTGALRNVSRSDATDSVPKWSPDGGRILFHSMRRDRQRNQPYIHVLESGETIAYETGLLEVYESNWAGDGAAISLVGLGNGPATVYTLDLLSGRVTPIHQDGGTQLQPQIITRN